MKRTTLLTIALLSLMTGCGLVLPDPCADGSPLFAKLTTAQQDACSECGAVECSSGGTGGDDNDAPDVYKHWEDDQFGVWANSVDAADYSSWTAYECVHASYMHPHVDSLLNSVEWEQDQTGDLFSQAGQRLDLFCDTSPHPDDNRGHSLSSQWRMCAYGDEGPNRYYKPARHPRTVADVLDLEWSIWPPAENHKWTEHGYCESGGVKSGVCALVAVGGDYATGALDPEAGVLWTCGCEVDDDCQDGAVCEAGWTWEGPTLCTWDDGSGTPNGAAPDGPEIYGLTRWAEGISVNGDTITLTPKMTLTLVQMLASGAILNDDIAFDLDGTLVTCGPTSLCAHVGLSVGDRLVATQEDIDAFAAGMTTLIEVRNSTSHVRWLSVSID